MSVRSMAENYGMLMHIYFLFQDGRVTTVQGPVLLVESVIE